MKATPKTLATGSNNPNKQVSVNVWNAGHNVHGQTRAELQALTAVAGQVGYVKEAGREGEFVFDTSNLASLVTDDPLQGACFPPTSAPTGASGAWVRTGRVLTPGMFGAVLATGFTTAERDTSTDTSVALQAFFDHAFSTKNAAKFYYDWSGTWAIGRPMFLVFPNDKGQRCGRMGTLHILPVGSQTTPFTKDNWVLTVHGPRQTWDGILQITDSDGDGSTIYANRRYHNGMLCRFASQSSFPVVRVDCAKRDGVWCSSELGVGADTYRAGTAYEVIGPNTRNNIGIIFKDIYCRCIGSGIQSGVYTHSQAVTSSTNGGLTAGVPGTFTSGEAGYEASGNQRTRLVIASTADLLVDDWGARRVEVLPADYTTIAASNAAATLTFATTNATTAKIVVGHKITPQSGANSGTEFTVTNVAAGVLTVYPRPVVEAATAVTGLFSAWELMQVQTIQSSTTIDVFPWDNPANNSVWYSFHGRALHTTGQDTANICVTGKLAALNSAIGLGSRGLYGPHIASFETDYTSAGVEIGRLQASHSGLAIDQYHIENAGCTIIQVTGPQITIMKGDSGALYLNRVWQAQARTAGSNIARPSGLLTGTTIDSGDYRLQSMGRTAYSGQPYDLTSPASPGGLGNHPSINRGTLEGDSGTVFLRYDEHVARLYGEHNKAQLYWYKTDGTTPSGAITLQIDDNLTIAGWTVVGGLSITTTAPCKIIFVFRNETKTIVPIKIGLLAPIDDAYAAGWNGSTLVPTRNAVYDKIESLKAAARADDASTIPAAAPAGGTGTAAGGWDTAANRDAAITTINDIRTAVSNLKTEFNDLLAKLRTAGTLTP